MTPQHIAFSIDLDEAEEILSDPDAELTDIERSWLINWLASNDRAAS
jgi:hypothetical protein